MCQGSGRNLPHVQNYTACQVRQERFSPFLDTSVADRSWRWDSGPNGAVSDMTWRIRCCLDLRVCTFHLCPATMTWTLYVESRLVIDFLQCLPSAGVGKVLCPAETVPAKRLCWAGWPLAQPETLSPDVRSVGILPLCPRSVTFHLDGKSLQVCPRNGPWTAPGGSQWGRATLGSWPGERKRPCFSSEFLFLLCVGSQGRYL